MAAFMIFFGYWLEFLSYFLVIVIHEFAHAEMSKRMGYRLSEMNLMPYGANLKGSFEGVKCSHEVIIAIIGPLVNFILAVVCIALWWIIPSSYNFTSIFVSSNLNTAWFNLLPIFPLDGGRAVLALISLKMPRQKAYKIIRVLGIIGAIVFSVMFVITLYDSANFSFIFNAVFFVSSTIVPDKNSTYQRLYTMGYRSEKLKKGLQVKEVMVINTLSIIELLRMLNANYFYKFIVVDNTFKEIAVVDELKLEKMAQSYDKHIKIGDVILARVKK